MQDTFKMQNKVENKLLLKILFLLVFCATFSQVNAQTINRNYFRNSDQSEVLTTSKANENSSTENTNQTSSQTQNYVRPNAEKRFKRYANSVIGPFALIGTAFSAGISTVANEPEEWKKNGEGFARRFASNLGRSAIRETIIYGTDEVLKIDSRFYRSQKRDTGSKIKNALLSTVTARKPNGKRVLGVSRIVGTYTANVISAETWFPKRFDYKDGLRGGTASLGFNALFNLFREFVLKK